jgi:hypothetical protein
MKSIKYLLIFPAMAFFILTSCENALDITDTEQSILPEDFRVDIPSSISSDTGLSGGRPTNQEEPTGDELYDHLRFFIHVGEEASIITSEIIRGIRELNITAAASFSYKSDEDGRSKNIEIVEEPVYDGKIWEYGLTISDSDSTVEADSGRAIQVFWSNSPVEGIAILKPYNIDRANTMEIFKESIYRIDYSEVNNAYDATMEVSIVGLPETYDRYWMSNLKMYVTKKGDFVEVHGSSIHPDAFLFQTDKRGFSWTFVAAASEAENIGVAEVGLPPNNLNTDDREALLKTYSMKSVLRNEILTLYNGQVTQEQIDAYLINSEAPGFFNADGFVQGGVKPSDDYDIMINAIEGLTPYNPSTINNLRISFLY